MGSERKPYSPPRVLETGVLTPETGAITGGDCAYHDRWIEGEPCTCEEQLASAALDAATGQLNSLSNKLDGLNEELKKPPCRRCSECKGCEHHWLENGVPVEDACPHGEQLSTDCETCILAAPDYVCKHCPAQGDSCPECGLGIEPEETCGTCKGVGTVVRP